MQSGDADATWQSIFDGRLHKIGREERKRNRYVDLAYAALFAFRDEFDAGLCIIPGNMVLLRLRYSRAKDNQLSGLY